MCSERIWSHHAFHPVRICTSLILSIKRVLIFRWYFVYFPLEVRTINMMSVCVPLPFPLAFNPHHLQKVGRKLTRKVQVTSTWGDRYNELDNWLKYNTLKQKLLTSKFLSSLSPPILHSEDCNIVHQQSQSIKKNSFHVLKF